MSPHPGASRRGALIALVLLVCAGLSVDVGAQPRRSAINRPQPTLRIEPLVIVTQRGPVRVQAEIADTERTRNVGMMWRTTMAPNAGMLFDFNPPRDVSFWMHNTLIPLDMIFIAPDGRIISIARSARPRDDTPIPSGGVVRGVLEMRGGRAAEIGILPGDRVRHRIFRSG